VPGFAVKSLVLATLAAALATVSLTIAGTRPGTVAAAAAPAARIQTPPPQDDHATLVARKLLMPVQGVKAADIRDNFEEGRGKRRHEAIDILAPRDTPVLAVDDGRIGKLFRSLAGGITIYQFDPSERFIYYYAHLERYADGVKEGKPVKRGEVIGYVGTSGNAPKNTPHLHFTIFRATAEKKWWKGEAINPYPYLAAAR
jgi:peptidoglycan LD-endopeptidase LytH